MADIHDDQELKDDGGAEKEVELVKEDENTHVATSKRSGYKVTIKRDICIGAATCVAIAGETFDLDEENLVIIKEGEWDEDEIVLAAAQSCPVFAIIIEDLETGEQVFPDPI